MIIPAGEYSHCDSRGSNLRKLRKATSIRVKTAQKNVEKDEEKENGQ